MSHTIKRTRMGSPCLPIQHCLTLTSDRSSLQTPLSLLCVCVGGGELDSCLCILPFLLYFYHDN